MAQARTYWDPTAAEREKFLRENPGDVGRIKEAFSRPNEPTPVDLMAGRQPGSQPANPADTARNAQMAADAKLKGQQDAAIKAAQVTPASAGGGGGGGGASAGMNAPIDAAALAGLQAAAQPPTINPTPMGDELGLYLGQRTPPQYDNILAGLRRIY